MDRISGLPDDLLVKILSFVPTKVAVSTSILSKRWEFFWMWLPKLDYINIDISQPGLRGFIDKNLPLHRAPVIESLCLGLISDSKAEDIKRWVEIAVSRHVRELEISHYPDDDLNVFPSSFYTCKSLVFLKLECVTLMDVPSTVCLPSLKTLKLVSLQPEGNETFQRFLDICPVLEDLSVECDDDDMFEFTVIVPALQSLSLVIYSPFLMYGIDTPSLKYFKLVHCPHYYGESYAIKSMPKLREAYIDVAFSDLKSIIGSITSVKRLTICTKDHLYGDGFVFNQLEHLKLCLCRQKSQNLLGQLLKDSPNLRVLDIFVMEDHWGFVVNVNDMVCWNQPSPVPECLLSSLQIFNWSQSFEIQQDKDIAVYVLKNARRLKRASILDDCVPNLTTFEELTLCPRASSTCELEFVEDHNGT